MAAATTTTNSARRLAIIKLVVCGGRRTGLIESAVVRPLAGRFECLINCTYSCRNHLRVKCKRLRWPGDVPERPTRLAQQQRQHTLTSAGPTSITGERAYARAWPLISQSERDGNRRERPVGQALRRQTDRQTLALGGDQKSSRAKRTSGPLATCCGRCVIAGEDARIRTQALALRDARPTVKSAPHNLEPLPPRSRPLLN
jgi:hypothetical protein